MTQKAIKRIAIAFSALFVWAFMATGQASAQQINDREAPVIQHEVESAVAAGARQVFTAAVTDNLQVDQVILYYRFRGQNTYLQKAMVAVSNNVYVGIVGTSPDSRLGIEYFIRASDTAGFYANQGYAYQPLLRSIATLPTLAATPAQTPSETAAASSGPSLSRKLLYVAGGLVVAGLLSSALNDDGNDSGSETFSTEPVPSNDDCQPGSCSLRFVLPQPQ